MNPTLRQQLFAPRILISFLMGFTCDVPLLSTSSVLEAWTEEPGVGLSMNGWLALYRLGRRT
jgi:PAT family beta-lactamase induction signal transducer AmpG